MHDLLKHIGQEDVDVIDRELGFKLCRREGIKSIALGSYTKAGDVFVMDVKVLDIESKRILKGVSSRGKGVHRVERQCRGVTRDSSARAKRAYRSCQCQFVQKPLMLDPTAAKIEKSRIPEQYDSGSWNLGSNPGFPASFNPRSSPEIFVLSL